MMPPVSVECRLALAMLREIAPAVLPELAVYRATRGSEVQDIAPTSLLDLEHHLIVQAETMAFRVGPLFAISSVAQAALGGEPYLEGFATPDDLPFHWRFLVPSRDQPEPMSEMEAELALSNDAARPLLLGHSDSRVRIWAFTSLAK